MASTVRQPKPTRKGPTDTSRRAPAWSTGARASPTFTPPANHNRAARPATPATQDRVLQSLAGLTGTTIALSTKTGQRYEAVIASTSGEGDTTGVTLKDVKELTNPGAPLKESLFIASTNIDTWTSGPADSKPTSNGSAFKTDVDISQQGREAPKHRELQAWKPSGDIPDTTLNLPGGTGDEGTFGVGTNGSWDQFAVNEQLYGVKTQFDEELYTTKLDRSAADFKERERKAQRIANEIMGTSTNNPHLAEERNQNVDDSGINEEDKYSTVVRGQNAYVPPGARRPGVTSPPQAAKATTSTADIPKVSINGPDGSIQEQQSNTPSNSSKAPSPAPSSTNSNKPPADPLPAFRDFVTNEKQRLTQKRQALVKSEMDKRMAELVKFSQSFKLNKPIPDDLVPILAKDEEKQKLIREKASKDAASAQARAIGSTANAGPVPGARAPVQSSNKVLEARKANPPSTATSKPTTLPPSASATPQKTSTASVKPNGATDTPPAKKPVSMFIQTIPPFKGNKTRPSAPAVQPNGSAQAQAPAQLSTGDAQPQSSTIPLSPTSANNRLNVNASSFRPNPNASTFKPGAPSTPGPSASSTASVSPKPKTETASPAPNAFFGTRPIKKNTPVNIKDDFNPFKHNKVAEASSIAAMWPYNGKRYIQMFPPPQQHPPQHSPHMGPPHAPPPMPPPPYEEDSNGAAAAAAARSQQQQQYVYAYPPYGYPAQPMMPGMVPQGPPGAYVPAPFMQPMPYPPGMPPPNAMYHSPSMGQMPPQAYMPPPPGTYPPPPNGAGPRPSMPPTPIPAHAHPYYHQSPQLQHAVPYPMMMPPPGGPNMPPHQYEQGPAPPVQMGGHA